MEETPKPEVEPTQTPGEPATEAQIEAWEAEAQQTADNPEAESVDDAAGPADFSWQASEFIHHQKQAGWYGILAIVIILLVGVAAITKQWFSVAVFVAMAGALAVYAKKEPRTLNYHISSDGITVENKLYRFDQFRSFAVFNDVAWHSIDLDPTQRFLPRLTMIFETKDLNTIVSILSQYLPRADRQPDLVERLTRTLKF